MYVQRDMASRFLEVSEAYRITALVGPRQAGKTTMLRHLMSSLNASYVLFDDPDARSLFEEDVKKFRTQYMDGYDLTVLDEVHYCSDAGMKLKYLADTGSRMWITSSSETLLGKDILSYLVGRAAVLRLYPFNINEFLRARGQKEFTPAILERQVWEHMTYGGFPQVVLTGSTEMKKTVLANLHETMILRDVARTFSIDNISSLERLSRYLAVNDGGILSYSKAADALGISFRTLKKYLDALTKSYLVAPVPPFFTNRNKELSKQPKIYFMDTGIRNTVADTYPGEPDGTLFENYVFSELVKIGLEPRYWRTKSGAEVDFIVRHEGEIIPVEVKIRASPGKVERGLRSFMERYGVKTALVVSYRGEKGETRLNGSKVTYTDIPGLWEFFGGSPLR
ncbi:MAG: ATP-binding protein [Thermoplasmata archaeon]|nr:ATP-binding protein [Thermoplasmata archaeon]